MFKEVSEDLTAVVHVDKSMQHVAAQSWSLPHHRLLDFLDEEHGSEARRILAKGALPLERQQLA
jgi:hypothetical protein